MGSPMASAAWARIIGPLGLALIVGSSNYLKPDVPLPRFDGFHLSGLLGLMAARFITSWDRDPGQVDRAVDKELAEGLI